MREIPLTRGMVAIVDDEDYPLVAARSWHAHRGNSSRAVWYAGHTYSVNGGYRRTLMHREILGAPRTTQVDHVNGNGLDNRRANIRLCTPTQNMANRSMPLGLSGYRGVYRKCGRWRAVISINRRLVYFGNFDDKIEAALAYDAAARRQFGAFARLNFPNENPGPLCSEAGVCDALTFDVGVSAHAPIKQREA